MVALLNESERFRLDDVEEDVVWRNTDVGGFPACLRLALPPLLAQKVGEAMELWHSTSRNWRWVSHLPRHVHVYARVGIEVVDFDHSRKVDCGRLIFL